MLPFISPQAQARRDGLGGGADEEARYEVGSEKPLDEKMMEGAVRFLQMGPIATSTDNGLTYVLPRNRMVRGQNDTVLGLLDVHVYATNGSMGAVMYERYTKERDELRQRVLMQIRDCVYEAIDRQGVAEQTRAGLEFYRKNILARTPVPVSPDSGPLAVIERPMNMVSNPAQVVDALENKQPVSVETLVDAAVFRKHALRGLMLSTFMSEYLSRGDSALALDEFFRDFLAKSPGGAQADDTVETVRAAIHMQGKGIPAVSAGDKTGHEIVRMTRTAVVSQLMVVANHGERVYDELWRKMRSKAVLMDQVSYSLREAMDSYDNRSCTVTMTLTQAQVNAVKGFFEKN